MKGNNSIRRPTVRLLLMVVLVWILQIAGAAIPAQKTVLILNSYHQGYAWSDEETNGVVAQLQQYDAQPIQFHIEYLDTKNHNDDQHMALLYQDFKVKYGNEQIDVIIAMDDNAFKFALEHRQEIFSDAPIVFSGINNVSAKTLLENTSNITGVFEDNDPAGTLNAILHINPNVTDVYVIYDQSESGISTWELVRQAAGQAYPQLKLHPWSGMAESDMVAQAMQLDSSAVLLVTSYVLDENDVYVSPRDFCERLSGASVVPVYHLYKFALGYGTIGGSLLDGSRHGGLAAGLAIRILGGERADDIPFSMTASTELAFDYNQLVKYGLSEVSLPDGSTVMNKPYSFFEQYRFLVIGTFAVFFLLLGAISVLVYNIRRRKQTEVTLSASHQELLALYDQLEAAEEQLQFKFDEISEMAYHDPLTKLPNRTWLESVASHEIWPFASALIVIDIDKFKYINDGFGHHVGDLVLCEVSKKLSTLADLENCHTTRLESDEFAILYNDSGSLNDLEAFIKRMHVLVEEPVYIGGYLIKVGFSIGAALRSQPTNNLLLDDAIRQAYLALHVAKIRDKDRYCIFEKTLENKMKEKLETEGRLQRAIRAGEFSLYYQPQYDIQTKRIAGLEALLRWNDPERGLILPGEFIKVAEESRLILPIGDIVFEDACRFASRVYEETGAHVLISVNVSSHQLQQHDFVETIQKLIPRFEAEQMQLAIEITETALINDFEDSISKLHELKGLGIRIHLDDFGTGYSSLNYVKTLPIDVLKIDKGFIDDLGNPDGDCIVCFIISLAHELGIKIIAEGVETEEQWNLLASFGCDTVQGFLKGRPMPEDDIIELLRKQQDAP